MKYDAYGKDGKPFPYPCHFTDATGAILTPIKSCDTETGECERYVLDSGGHFVTDANGTPITVTDFYPAPLRINAGAAPRWPQNRAPFPRSGCDRIAPALPDFGELKGGPSLPNQSVCPKCGGQRAHYRLRGYRCARCD